ncbi:MAG: S8 family serine peptidase [Thermoanaerobaculia bacterium]
MRSRLSALVLFFLAVSAFAAEGPRNADDRPDRERARAGRQFLLSPQHVLSDAERAQLAAKGLTVLRPMSDGRYLVRIAPDATVDASDERIRSLEAITPEKKLQRSAYRAAAQGRAFSTVNVIFSDDVPFEDARASILAAGGELVDAFATDFVPLQRIRAKVPSVNLGVLAADERVLTVYGGAPFRPKTYNQTQAILADVAPLAAAPYNLAGDGLVLSYFELGPAYAAHREFGGRLTVEFKCAATNDDSCNDLSNKAHATHTGGTLIAAGLDPESKGMAPVATLHGFRALDDSPDWLTTKTTTLKTLGVVVDNNSWGVILGWNRDNSGNWIWYGFDEGIGGYESTDAAIDHAARVNGALMVHSAGNEATTGGPKSAPFAHQHVDDNFTVIPGETFCYSNDGSGTDCVAPCSTGLSHCEIDRHPFHTPFGSVGLFASPKNILTVGATSSSPDPVTLKPTIASFSSRGPTRDGRVKPEISAPGVNVRSTLPNDSYGNESGTSMASPLTAGTGALLAQLWKKTFNALPQPVDIKTILIAGAQDLGNPGPDYTFGFGFLDGKASADLIVADNGQGKRIRIDTIAQGAQFQYPLTITSTQNVRVVLGWADPEVLNLGDAFAGNTLINDLDVKVLDPSGNTTFPYVLNKDIPDANATRGVNTVDNTEEVEIANANPGVYRIVLDGTRVVSPQRFVLIGNGEIGAAIPPCIDPNEPNDSPTAAFGYLSSGVATAGKICGATDVDFFKVRTNSSDPIRVTVNGGDTPLRVTMSANGTAFATMDVGANSTNTLEGSPASILPLPLPTIDVFIKIEPIGTVGTNASYTVTATYTFTPPPHRRATRG